METPEPLVEITKLAKAYGSNQVLKSIDLSLAKGETLAILGPGGSGKSTLLKIIMNLIPPDSGDVFLLGRQIWKLSRSEKQEILKRVAMAFQLGGLFDFLNVRENILFAMENMTKLSLVEMEERVADLLAAVNLPHAANKLPSELSGGMRRRVGIVRAMATSPELGLFDEPTAGLDPVTSTVVIDMIHRIARQLGTTCLCVTSSVEVAFTFSKRVAVLKDGFIIGTGTWRELQERDDEWLQHFLNVRKFTPQEV